MTRVFHRALLADLPDWEARGWRPAVVAPCGAVGAEPFCAWTLAATLVENGPEPLAGARMVDELGRAPARWEAA